jgi:hypothetical protein
LKPPAFHLKLRTEVIIVSGSSAEAVRPNRTHRSPLTYNRSSTERNDTPRHANVRPISVHTEEISSDQWFSNLRLVTNHRDHLSVPRR